MDILSILILGLVQGISEWLPISSKTMVSIAYLKFLGGTTGPLISILIFVHLGTLIAATVYFRSILVALAHQAFEGLKAPRRLLDSPVGFYLAALLFTGLVGGPILLAESLFLPSLNASFLFAIMGAGLLITAFLLYSKKFGPKSERAMETASWKDGALAGAFQALSTIPGVSRSGSTTSALALRGFSALSTFELSFILSIPTVFCAEILFWSIEVFKAGTFTSVPLADGLLLAISSCIFGYLTIGALIRLASRINLWQLAASFGVIMLLVALMGVG